MNWLLDADIAENDTTLAFGATYPRKVRCLREAADPHHIVLRSTKRDDRLANLLAVCRHHHYVLDREQRRAKVEAKQARSGAEASHD